MWPSRSLSYNTSRFTRIIEINIIYLFSSLAGFGVGIPVSMAYIKFVKGKMEYQSLPGIGTDVYIKVPQIAGLMDKLHI